MRDACADQNNGTVQVPRTEISAGQCRRRTGENRRGCWQNSTFIRNSCSTASSFISRWWLVWTWHVGGFSSSTVPVPSFPPRRTLIAIVVAIYKVLHKASALALEKALCVILAPLQVRAGLRENSFENSRIFPSAHSSTYGGFHFMV